MSWSTSPSTPQGDDQGQIWRKSMHIIRSGPFRQFKHRLTPMYSRDIDAFWPPFQHSQVLIRSSIGERMFVPGTLMCLAILSSIGARLFIPGTLVRQGPLQQFKVTIEGSIDARQFISGTLMCPGPVQQFKVTILGSSGARPSTPGALM